jgi:hypothetical protein
MICIFNKYYQDTQIKEVEMGAASSEHEEDKCLQILVGKYEGIRPTRSWESSINMDLREIGLKGGDWIHLTCDMNHWRALFNTAMNLNMFP